MRRHELSDEQWARLRRVLPKQRHGPKSKRGERKFINAVLYRAKPERKKKRRLDRRLYGHRYLVECFFHNLKRFRAVATRYEKTATDYLGLVQLACAWLWLT